MKGVGKDIGVIHFVGIGGSGMSGIAEVMHNLGYRIQGSDLIDSTTVDRLRKSGIQIHIGHSKTNIEGVSVVVISTAINRNNPEVSAALEARIPVVRRAEMLADSWLKSTIAVAGNLKNHTTSMIAALLDQGELTLPLLMEV